MLFDDVKAYIDANILYTEPFDSSTEVIQKKAINNAESILYSIYKRFSPETNPLPVDAIAYQAIYLLGKDDSDVRADNGATSIGFNGVSISFASKQRMVAPDVIRILGRRVGSYSVSMADTNRGIYSE